MLLSIRNGDRAGRRLLVHAHRERRLGAERKQGAAAIVRDESPVVLELTHRRPIADVAGDLEAALDRTGSDRDRDERSGVRAVGSEDVADIVRHRSDPGVEDHVGAAFDACGEDKHTDEESND